MKLQTASSVISLSKELETASAGFYEALAEKFAEGKESFLTYAKENRKYIVQTERSYYSVISDALEGCYSFNLDSDDYTLDTAVPASYADAVKVAIKNDETVVKFYSEAAQQSESLMADVPRTFKMIAKKKLARIDTLKSL